VPISDPRAFFARALAGNLNAVHGLARTHDGSDDAFDGLGQGRHAIANRASEVILDRDPAYVGKALIDLQIAAIGRQYREADRRGIIDQLQCSLLRKRNERRQRFGGSRSAVRAL
jgi:hypothetical protein